MYEKSVLSSGVRVVTSRMDHVRSVTIILYYAVGSRYESDDQAGITHFIEHMLFKGTRRRPDPIQITEEIEGVGGIINASTGRESTDYWVKIPSAHLERAFDVLADMVRDSAFTPGEIAKERGVIVEEIRGIADTPDDLIHDIIDEVVWDGQPVGRPVIGTEETVGALTRERLVSYWQEHYQPERLVIAAAGDLHHQHFVELAERAFGDLRQSAAASFTPATVSQQAPRVRAIARDTNEAHVCVAMPALPYTDDRRFTQDTIDTLLGAGMSSRLFREIRERRGLAYDVYSYFRTYADVGQGVVYLGTDPARVDQAVRAVLAELLALRDRPVGEDELTRAKELRKGRILMGLEDSRAVAGWIGSQELVYGQVFTPEELIERIDAVTTGDVGALAAELFRPERLNAVLIGPNADDDHLRSLLDL